MSHIATAEKNSIAPKEGQLRSYLEARESAWRGEQLAGDPIWCEKLLPEDLDDLRALVSRGLPPGKTLENLSTEDIPLPHLERRIKEWREQLDVRRGFLLVQSLPVEEWSEFESTLAYVAICRHMGSLMVQNSRGVIIGHVRDEGVKMDLSKPHIRVNETNNKIRFHVDVGDVVGLLCMHNVATGGISRIVSSHSVIAELLRRRPDLEATLFEPIPFDAMDLRDSTGKSWRDVSICRWRHGDLRVSFQADTISTAQDRGEAPKLTPSQADMVQLMEDIAEDPKFHLEMYFKKGELQFINNNHTLHSRTPWEDADISSMRRHLLRAWIALH